MEFVMEVAGANLAQRIMKVLLKLSGVIRDFRFPEMVGLCLHFRMQLP